MGVLIQVSKFNADYFDRCFVYDGYNNRVLDFDAAHRESIGAKSEFSNYSRSQAIIENVLFVLSGVRCWNNVSPMCYELTKENLLKLKQCMPEGYTDDLWDDFMDDIDEILSKLEVTDKYVYTIDWG
jgi:hypothetical protein